MTKKPDISPQQALLYTGAVGSAACGFSSLIQDGNPIEKLYSKVDSTTSDSVGRKLLHWNALNQGGITALQCLAAYEKPSVKMMATVGSMYVASGALTSVHTCRDKAIKPEAGSFLALSQLALGGAMIGRAIYMHRHKDDVQ